MSSLSITPPTIITRYPGRVIVFNLLKTSRLKKLEDRETITKDEAPVSMEWTNEDNDNHLIVRLIFSDGYPWLVCHHGIFEAFRGVLIVPIKVDGMDGESTKIMLRDFANRGKNCIKRSFILNFESKTDSKVFRFAFNSMLFEYNPNLVERIKQQTTAEQRDIANCQRLSPQKKRRRINPKVKGEEETEETVENEEKIKNEAYKECLNNFERVDSFSRLDDEVSGTQDPFSI